MFPTNYLSSCRFTFRFLRYLLGVCFLAGLTLAVTIYAPSAGNPLTPGNNITAGDLLLGLSATGVITGLYEKEIAGTDHNISAYPTTLVGLVVEGAASDLPSSGVGVHYTPTGWTYSS